LLFGLSVVHVDLAGEHRVLHDEALLGRVVLYQGVLAVGARW